MENHKLTVVQVINRIEILKDEINKYTQVYYKLDDKYDDLRRFIRVKKALAQERLNECYRMEVIENAND